MVDVDRSYQVNQGLAIAHYDRSVWVAGNPVPVRLTGALPRALARFASRGQVFDASDLAELSDVSVGVAEQFLEDCLDRRIVLQTFRGHASAAGQALLSYVEEGAYEWLDRQACSSPSAADRYSSPAPLAPKSVVLDVSEPGLRSLVEQSSFAQVFEDPDEDLGRFHPYVLVIGASLDGALAQVRRWSERGHFGALLPVVVNRSFGSVGPWVEGFDHCVECLLAGIAELHVGDRSSRSESAFESAARTLTVGAGVLEVVKRSALSPPLRGSRALMLDAAQWSSTEAVVSRKPGCRVCGSAGLATSTRTSAQVMLDFEHSIERTWHHPSGIGTQAAHQAARDLQWISKLGHLGRARPGNGPADDATEVVRRLVGVLEHGVGLRGLDATDDRPPRRWAPTGGNLGSIEIYGAHGCGQGSGVPSLFLFDKATRGLVSMRSDPDAATAAASRVHNACAAGEVWEDDDLVLVLTGSWARVAEKYGRAFAYRLVHMDGGAALTHLCLSADRFGWSMCPGLNWSPAGLDAVLGLNPSTETVVATVRVRGWDSL